MTAGCGCRKRWYASKGKASAAIAGIKRHGEKRDRTPARAYPCPQSSGWHLTSSP